MSKKATTPETAVEAQAPAVPISLKRKLLEARIQFRSENTAFSKHFNLHSGFEAFSVHILAGNIEPVLNDLGIVTECQVLKWEKNGNVTVVECRLDFTDVETDEVFSLFTIGEGVDGSDKGVGKAISNARKQGHIQAFNLAIGVDVEDTDAKSNGVNSFGGAPGKYQPPQYQPQQYQQAQDFPQSASKPYEIETLDGEVIEVVELDLIARFIDLVNKLRTPEEVDAFSNRNLPLANRLEAEKSISNLSTLTTVLETRTAALVDGAHANAA